MLGWNFVGLTGCVRPGYSMYDDFLFDSFVMILSFFTDVDECADRTVCPSGICFNVPGGYNCGSCPNGFLGQGGQCVGRSIGTLCVCMCVCV